ncbi:hypothetical protein B9Z55_026361 [Caenorhabditis nigoni]|uniref:RING-type domain-containing protein n=1 Tax=Caenorhabditis nigoni TaxID=1611254 RepID=A0A2G5T2X4_9PELO|nr:hypothetical protein B9Z55_026361 [Caenorhabditis nigoni]
MLPGNSTNLEEKTARLTMSLKNMELELEKYKNYISNMNWEKEKSQDREIQRRHNDLQALEIEQLRKELLISNESKSLLMSQTSKLEEKNAELNRELVEAKLSAKKLSNELESAEEIVMLKQKDYNKVWDDMMFYKNKVDFPSNNQNLEHHVQTLERQLREEMAEKTALFEENRRLKGVFDPDACMICAESLPISKCMTPNCKGIFHNKCIKHWFDNSRETQKVCFVCNTGEVKIGEDNFRPCN